MAQHQISRRALLSALGGCVAASYLLSGRSPLDAEAAPARPSERVPLAPGGKPWNVVLLVSDEHSPHLGIPGKPDWVKTPYLDQLAREGLRLDHSYATSPVCAPARMGLFSGRYPQETGVLLNNHIFDPRNPTFANAFHAAGYQTIAIGKTHVNNVGPTYGFDVWWTKESQEFQALEQERRKRGAALPVPASEAPIWAGIQDHRLRGAPIDAEWTPISGAVLDLVERALSSPPTSPFLLYASWVEPHWVWNLPKDLYDMYDPASIPLPQGPATLTAVPAQIAQQNGWDRMTEAQHRLCLSKYGAAVTYTDRVVGKILQLLEKSGAAERTLVIYTSDHGDMAAERRMWLKGLMYDASAGTPMVMRMPGVLQPGQSSEVLFSGADLFPTMAGFAGVPVEQPVSGKDLSGALRGLEPGPEHLYCSIGGRPNTQFPAALMVRDARHKLIRYHGTPETAHHEMRELYDMQADPWETQDVSGSLEGAEKALELARLGDTWLAGLQPSPYGLNTLQAGRVLGPNDDLPD